MTKYRIKEYDVVNDIYLLQQRVFWIFWKTVGFGSREKLKLKIKELEN